MSDIIDTKSKLFKLYAARRVRKGPCWDVEDVLEMDIDTINICTYTRQIGLEVGHHFMIAMLKLFGGLLLSFMILTPLLTYGFYFFTDNPFIIWFGEFGRAMMFIDAMILVIVIFCLLMYGLGCLRDVIWAKTKSATNSLTATSTAALWVKNKHGKFCTKLNFDRETTNNREDDDDDDTNIIKSERHLIDADWPHE